MIAKKTDPPSVIHVSNLSYFWFWYRYVPKTLHFPLIQGSQCTNDGFDYLLEDVDISNTLIITAICTSHFPKYDPPSSTFLCYMHYFINQVSSDIFKPNNYIQAHTLSLKVLLFNVFTHSPLTYWIGFSPIWKSDMTFSIEYLTDW